MRKIVSLVFLFAGLCFGQGNPPPFAAYILSGGVWTAAPTTSSTSPLPFTPPPVALYCFNGSGQWVPADSSCFGGGGGGSGTVTSVAMTVPAWLTVAGSPITVSGTLAVTATTGQTANEFLATPNGSTGAVGLRTIVAADLPAIPLSGLATQANDTVVMNATGATAVPTAVAMPTCTTGADLYNTTSHSWSCVSVPSSGFPITIGSTSVAAGSTTTTIAGLTLSSPTLTTPALGTPASGVITNLTGTCTACTANAAVGISTNGTANQVWGMNSGGSAQGWQNASGGGVPTWIVDEMIAEPISSAAPSAGPIGWFVSNTGTGSAAGQVGGGSGAAGHTGIYQVVSGTASNSYGVINASTFGSGSGPWYVNSGNSNVIKAAFSVQPSLNSSTQADFRIGFGSQGVGAGPNPPNEIIFDCSQSQNGNTDWWAYGSTTSDTGVTCSTSSWQTLEISITGLSATYYINGTAVVSGLTVAANNYNLFFSSWSHGSSTSGTLFVDWVAVPTTVTGLI